MSYPMPEPVDISEAGFEWCPKCDDWHLPDERSASY